MAAGSPRIATLLPLGSVGAESGAVCLETPGSAGEPCAGGFSSIEYMAVDVERLDWEIEALAQFYRQLDQSQLDLLRTLLAADGGMAHRPTAG